MYFHRLRYCNFIVHEHALFSVMAASQPILLRDANLWTRRNFRFWWKIRSQRIFLDILDRYLDMSPKKRVIVKSAKRTEPVALRRRKKAPEDYLYPKMAKYWCINGKEEENTAEYPKLLGDALHFQMYSQIFGCMPCFGLLWELDTS